MLWPYFGQHFTKYAANAITIHLAIILPTRLHGVESQIYALSSHGHEFSPLTSYVVLILCQVIVTLN